MNKEAKLTLSYCRYGRKVMEHQEFLIEFKYKVHVNYVLWSELQILLTEWQCLSVE